MKQNSKGQKLKVGAEPAIMSWLRQENKPATAQSLVDALQSKYSKPVIQKALEVLVEQNEVEFKDFKKVRLYYSRLNPSSPADSWPCAQETDDQTVGHVQNLEILATQLGQKYSFLTSVPSSRHLKARREELEKSISVLSSKLTVLKSSNTFAISSDPVAETLEVHACLAQWRTRKDSVRSMLQNLDISTIGVNLVEGNSIGYCMGLLPLISRKL